MTTVIRTTPIITIDGPAASGKGTVANLVAKELGFHYLDSGALYRITAYASQQKGLAWVETNQHSIADHIQNVEILFEAGRIFLDGLEITEKIRSEQIGEGASKVASFAAIRTALVARQRAFAHHPGLVADGRDMGTVIFPNATLKVFLTASAAIRAERRYKQLLLKEKCVSLNQILVDIQKRDQRDQERTHAPLVRASDAVYLDTDPLTIEQAVSHVLSHYHQCAVIGSY